MAEEEQNTEGAAGDGTEGAGAGGGKKKKLLMMVSAGVAVLGLLIGGGVFFLLKGNSHKADDETAAPAAAFYDVPQFAVNLLSDGDEQHFLKLKLALELNDAKDAEKIERVLPKLQDDFQAFLRQMRVDDLRGSAGLATLKDALLLRANQILTPIVVKDVLFREVLVQ